MAKNNYEQMRITERLKEFRTLYIFIILASLIALLLMNVLIFPIALFAAKKPLLFTSAVKWGTLALIVFYAVYRIIVKIREYTAGGYSLYALFKAAVKKKAHSLLYVIIITIAAALLFFAVYLAMRYNYFLLYEILN